MKSKGDVRTCKNFNAGKNWESELVHPSWIENGAWAGMRCSPKTLDQKQSCHILPVYNVIVLETSSNAVGYTKRRIHHTRFHCGAARHCLLLCQSPDLQVETLDVWIIKARKTRQEPCKLRAAFEFRKNIWVQKTFQDFQDMPGEFQPWRSSGDSSSERMIWKDRLLQYHGWSVQVSAQRWHLPVVTAAGAQALTSALTCFTMELGICVPLAVGMSYPGTAN